MLDNFADVPAGENLVDIKSRVQYDDKNFTKTKRR